ncbi:hypothetical protein [Streptomyces halobius]|uniref:Uncharacterized protein n=1 Tax=Streptomyces halobius TaxID=2879846 RepID=A0ABY4MFI1_9ACTN|nr:hypothetical protein [Streptomyces halobius]UQA96546.1 hypothetical protein K9S39_35885 [Streptomyces halobius]
MTVNTRASRAGSAGADGAGTPCAASTSRRASALIARGAQLSTHVLADGSEGVFISAGHSDDELVGPPDGRRIATSPLRIAGTRGTPPRLPPGLGS